MCKDKLEPKFNSFAQFKIIDILDEVEMRTHDAAPTLDMRLRARDRDIFVLPLLLTLK